MTMNTIARFFVLLLAAPAFAAGNDPMTPPPAPAPALVPAPAPAAAPAPAPAPVAEVAKVEPEKKDRGAFLIGLKAGGLFAEPFTNGILGPSFLVDVELGYVLPFLKRGIAVIIDGGYSQPTANGAPTDPRVDANSGTYTWNLIQREVLLGLTLMYRATWIGEGKLVPYLGVGPRLWLLQTSVTGCTAGTTNMPGACGMAANPITESLEQSTKVGLSVPLGVDYALGPGRIFLEAQLLWAPIDHRVTGDSSVGSLTAELGYRLFL
jgi:hypothetical protein